MTIDEMKQLALAIKEAFAELNYAVDDDRLCRAVIDVSKSAMWR
jgi:anti-sigma28 factor (negative regulator of flagellin synthesis)